MHNAARITHEEINPTDTLDREDPSLVASAKAGDTEAFNALASPYRARILHIARRITKNHDDAEDVTQGALMKAFLNVRGFKGTCAFVTWLKRIVINEALMLRRRLKVRSEVGWPRSSQLGEFGVPVEVADGRPDPEQCYEMHERHQILVAEIKQLKPESQLALEMRALNDSSIKDLAKVQGISVSAAKTRLFRSRTLLRARFTRSLNAGTTGDIRTAGLPV